MSPEDYLPLRPVEFEILVSLSGGDRHGYAILKDTTSRGDGRAAPGLATLYRAILRLEKQALIGRVADGGQAPDDERRRVYQLTPVGRAVVVAEARRLSPLVALARRAGP